MKVALIPPMYVQEQAYKFETKPTKLFGFIKISLLPLICLFVVLGLNAKPLSAKSLSQSSSVSSTNSNMGSFATTSSTDLLENSAVANTVADFLEIINLPADCDLVANGVIPEFWVGEEPFNGSYSVWQNCSDDLPLLGLFLARPAEDDNTMIVLKRPLEKDDDLTPFQLALSEQLQQQVVWGATERNPLSIDSADQSEDGFDSVSSDSSMSTSPSTRNPTRTPVATERPSVQVTPTATPAPTSVDETVVDPELTVPVAIVAIETLNMRSGPGVSYPRVGIVSQGDQLAITGRDRTCSWIQFQTPTGIMAWVSSGPQFVRINGDCGVVSVVQPPPVPTAVPTSAAPNSSSGGLRPSSANPDNGCYLIENFLGVTLTFTMTRSTDQQSRTFTVPLHGEKLECFEPGPYTYTIDAPPPWNSINGILDVAPGDQLRWAVGGE